MGADDARKLFVGGLADSVTEETLRDIFEGSGQPVTDVHVPRDRESGRPRGFAFVTFTSADAAETARRAIDGLVHGGRSISVRRFSQDGPRRSPAERPSRGDDRTVFVGKLPYSATPEEVEELFTTQELGPVVRVSLPAGPDGRPRGFGFVTLESAEAAAAAVERLSGAQLHGRTLVVTPAQPKGRPASRDGDTSSRGEGGFRSEGRAGGRFGASRFGASDDSTSFDDPAAESARPLQADDDGYRRDDRKRGKKDKKKRSSERTARRERGGAGTWHRWQRDDD